MLKYQGGNPWMKNKKKGRMIKYCCFIWTQTPILAPSVFWPKFGSDKDWVCQLLIQFVQDKSLGSQEETYYALHWQRGPVVLFLLRAWDQKGKEGKTQEHSGTSTPPRDPRGLLPPPYNPQNGAGPPPATATTTVAARGVGEVRGAEPTTQVQGHCCCWQNQNRRVRPQA